MATLATERSFADLPPQRLYVDNDIIVAHLFSAEPHHDRCQAFVEWLFQYGLTVLYVSCLSPVEFAHVIRRKDFRDRLPDDLRAQFRLTEWEQPLIRQHYLQTFSAAFESLLDQFQWYEISITPEVRRLAVQYIEQYNLGAQDAIHLASAVSAGVFDFASLDQSYRRIPGLHLWNDRLHGSLPPSSERG
jgi:predicted nucleic acid-binding protein